MTQDERWNIRYQEVMAFIESNHRNPSKHRKIRGRFFDPFLIKGLKYPVRNKRGQVPLNEIEEAFVVHGSRFMVNDYDVR